MSRANQWFVLGDGIAREVITADIQRYLGPDALVRPGPGTGEYEGRSGYWITAYRTLTSQMIADLKLDSTRWGQEQGRQETGRGVAYQDSNTHAARQHWGPSKAQDTFDQPRQSTNTPHYTPVQHPQQYPSSDQHYTITPTSQYSNPVYSTPGAHAAPPRTLEYGNYSSAGREPHPNYGTQQYSYPQHTPQDYNRQPAAPPHGYAAPSPTPAPGYYIASDGRQYPLPTQQSTQTRRSNNS